jgi:hypothetical protein
VMKCYHLRRIPEVLDDSQKVERARCLDHAWRSRCSCSDELPIGHNRGRVIDDVWSNALESVGPGSRSRRYNSSAHSREPEHDGHSLFREVRWYVYSTRFLICCVSFPFSETH